MASDRTTKFLLVMVATGLWGMLLRPMFTAVPAKAQAAVPPKKKIYTLGAFYLNKDNVVVETLSFRVPAGQECHYTFEGGDLDRIIGRAAKDGWQVHSIESSGGDGGRYMVLFESTE